MPVSICLSACLSPSYTHMCSPKTFPYLRMWMCSQKSSLLQKAKGNGISLEQKLLEGSLERAHRCPVMGELACRMATTVATGWVAAGPSAPVIFKKGLLAILTFTSCLFLACSSSLPSLSSGFPISVPGLWTTGVCREGPRGF